MLRMMPVVRPHAPARSGAVEELLGPDQACITVERGLDQAAAEDYRDAVRAFLGERTSWIALRPM